MSQRASGFTLMALACFAGNSILCRLALAGGRIDAATFTCIRLASGALVLALLCAGRIRPAKHAAWASAVALFAYAAPFSYAYQRIGAGVGALVLFGIVQVTMIGWGVVRGERPSAFAWCGIVAAVAGLVFLTWRGATAPDALGVVVMALAGVAWAVYSLLGRKVVGEAIVATSMSFSRALPFTLVLAGVAFRNASSRPSSEGVLLAVASGAVTSGLGYSAWYVALRSLSATQAAVVQLTVPVITALAALILLAETPTLRLVVASVGILGGVAVTIRETTRARLRASADGS